MNFWNITQTALLIGIVVALTSEPVAALAEESAPQKVLWLGTAISGYHKLDEQISEVLSGPEGLGELELHDIYLWPMAQLFLPDDDPNKSKHRSLKQREEILQFLQEEKPAYLVIQTTLNYFQEDPEGGMEEAIRKLGELARANGGRVIFYETGWPTGGGLEAERETQNALARELDATVVPCWTLQEAFRQAFPEIDWTYNGDKRHPGKYFIYLNKLAFAKALTGKDLAEIPTTYPYRHTWKDDEGKGQSEMTTFTIPEEDAARIRQLVQEKMATGPPAVLEKR